jgi:hypothetical protein
MLSDAFSIVHYVYVFWLKNLAGFQDDFWHLFINIWIFGFCLISQAALTPLQFLEISIYHVCIGNLHPPESTITLTYYYIVQNTSAVIMTFVCVRLIIHRRQMQTQASSINLTPKQSYLIEMDKEAIISITESSGYFFIFVMFLLFNAAIKKSHDVFDFVAVCHSMLAGPSWLVLIIIGTIYWRNSKLRSWIWSEMISLLSEIQQTGPIDLSNNC